MVIFSLPDGYLYSSTNTQLFFIAFPIISSLFFQWSICHCWLGKSGNIESRFYEALSKLVHFISSSDRMLLPSMYGVVSDRIIQAKVRVRSVPSPVCLCTVLARYCSSGLSPSCLIANEALTHSCAVVRDCSKLVWLKVCSY